MRTHSTLRNAACAALVATIALVGGCGGNGSNDPAGKPTSNPGHKPMTETTRSQAVFAAGCFWGVEAAFRKVPGVADTSVGFIGGTVANPTYKQVCKTDTGHAEAVRVIFDPSVVSYEQLLEVFWSCHNPTTLNRQGPDAGSQYRSAIFFIDAEQQKLAEASLDLMQKSDKFSNKIVTKITSAGEFYLAEEYHQQYLEKRGKAACNSGIKPQ